MTFSVVIPSYNGEKHIEDTILSVLRQNRKADEIIVHNDNSNDLTYQICKKYVPEVTYYFNPEGPSGFVNGWNKSIHLANSDFIVVLHQDDLLYPSFLEEAENALNLYPDVRHLFTLCDYIDEDDSILNNGELSVLKGRSTDKILRYSGKEYVRAYQMNYNGMPHIHRCPGVITHRSIFEEGCNYRSIAGHISDDDFFYRVGQFTPVAGIMKSLAAFRIHNGSETGRLNDRLLVKRLARDYIFQVEQWQESDFMTNHEKSYFEFWAYHYLFKIYYYAFKTNDKELRQYANDLHKELNRLNLIKAFSSKRLKMKLIQFISRF